MGSSRTPPPAGRNTHWFSSTHSTSLSSRFCWAPTQCFLVKRHWVTSNGCRSIKTAGAVDGFRVLKVKTAYYAVQNVVSVFNDTLERIPDYPCEAQCPKPLAVFGHKDVGSGQQVCVFWDKSSVPLNNNDTVSATLTLTGATFTDPVWVDTIDLTAQGFQSVFLATGAQLARRIPLAGSEARGVLYGIDFLREVNETGRAALGKEIVVVGGGNVAMDVARAALRASGGGNVSVYCLESRAEMPAHAWEIDHIH